jgi:hypothetical protein
MEADDYQYDEVYSITQFILLMGNVRVLGGLREKFIMIIHIRMGHLHIQVQTDKITLLHTFSVCTN